MAMKKELSFIPSDSDTEKEAELKVSAEIQHKVDEYVIREERERTRIEESFEVSGIEITGVSKPNPQVSTSRSVKVEVDVHESSATSHATSSSDCCTIIKVVPAHQSKPKELYPELVVLSEAVSKRGKDSKVENVIADEEVIVISSDEDAEDGMSSSQESFSPNQEGSKRVRDLMFQQEMGKSFCLGNFNVNG